MNMDIEIYRTVTLKDLSYKFMMLFNTAVTSETKPLMHSCYRFDTPFNVDLHMLVKPLKNKITD